MKITKILLSILIAGTLIASGCSAVPETEQPTDIVISDTMLSIKDVMPSNIAESQNIQLQFSLDLLKELSQSKENIFYSSFSINQALTMAYFGADGDTQEEIKNTLGYAGLTIEDIAAYQKYLIETYSDSGDTTFYSANSMWIDDQLTVKDAYIQTMLESFDAEVANIDLQSNQALGVINGWIEKETNGMIDKLFEEPFDEMTALILMNAIYFKGQWTTPFNPELTYENTFNGASSSNQVDFMFSDETVTGYQSDDYKAINLSYGDDERFSFVAVLPEGDINDFINGLDADALNDVLTTFEEKEDPILLLPKFELEEKITLKDTLAALGMETAFTGDANFSEISDTELFISDVLHKARIIVDEEGTEAAAVTGLVMKATSMPVDQFEFVADREFMFFIMDNEEKTVLFSGVVYDLD